MVRKGILALIVAGALLIPLAGCPKSQCQTGSRTSETVNHHPHVYTCHNNEWIEDK